MQQRGRLSLLFGWLLWIALVAGILFLIVVLVRPLVAPPASCPLPGTDRPAAAERAVDSRYCYGGIPLPRPGFHDAITVLTNTAYLSGYSEEKRDPVWVCYRLFRTSPHAAPPRPSRFIADLRTKARIAQQVFSGSGFDRGHLAPNHAIAVCYGVQAQLETFLMSNIIPQRPRLNREVWERLERSELDDYASRYGQVWVIDGPVFGSRPGHLREGVAIPDSCYKIIIIEREGHARAHSFLIPQDVEGTDTPQQHLASVMDIEKRTGLDFFAGLPATLRRELEDGVR